MPESSQVGAPRYTPRLRRAPRGEQDDELGGDRDEPERDRARGELRVRERARHQLDVDELAHADAARGDDDDEARRPGQRGGARRRAGCRPSPRRRPARARRPPRRRGRRRGSSPAPCTARRGVTRIRPSSLRAATSGTSSAGASAIHQTGAGERHRDPADAHRRAEREQVLARHRGDLLGHRAVHDRRARGRRPDPAGQEAQRLRAAPDAHVVARRAALDEQRPAAGQQDPPRARRPGPRPRSQPQASSSALDLLRRLHAHPDDDPDRRHEAGDAQDRDERREPLARRRHAHPRARRCGARRRGHAASPVRALDGDRGARAARERAARRSRHHVRRTTRA